jgi:diaminopimelate epimerase
MCGNGSRCAARFAVDVLDVQARHVMHTVSGDLDAEYKSPAEIAVVMPDPSYFRVAHARVDGQELHHVWVGVPHTVVIVEDIARWDDERLRSFGWRLRFDRELYPEGTNLNIASQVSADTWRVRTYERGVEDITLACGTGNTATAYVAHELGLASFPFHSMVDGGNLRIDRRDGRYWLVGPAMTVMTGETSSEALLGD